jgi:hypothetical protein
LEQLLRQLPGEVALRLIREQLLRRLPAFERHHPGIHWPREFIEASDGTPSRGEREWPEIEDDFSGPGANNFTSAVEALWKASRLPPDDRQRAAELVSALAGALMAEGTERWGSRHPEEWTLWYQLAASGENDPRITSLQFAMQRDSEIVALQRSAWLEIADQVEATFRPS